MKESSFSSILILTDNVQATGEPVNTHNIGKKTFPTTTSAIFSQFSNDPGELAETIQFKGNAKEYGNLNNSGGAEKTQKNLNKNSAVVLLMSLRMKKKSIQFQFHSINVLIVLSQTFRHFLSFWMNPNHKLYMALYVHYIRAWDVNKLHINIFFFFTESWFSVHTLYTIYIKYIIFSKLTHITLKRKFSSKHTHIIANKLKIAKKIVWSLHSDI